VTGPDAADSSPASRYFALRDRVVAMTAMANESQLAQPVPACPEWTVQQLFTHVAAMPMTILAGEIPDEVMAGSDPNPWLARMVDEHGGRSVVDLARWWGSDDAALGGFVDGAELLLVDLFVHDSDLCGALGRPPLRTTAELDPQLDAALAALQPAVAAAELAPIAVDDGTGRRSSAAGAPGWVLRTDRWTAHRTLSSRRTRDEVLAIPHDGDPEPYLDLLDEHLPLPGVSLGE